MKRFLSLYKILILIIVVLLMGAQVQSLKTEEVEEQNNIFTNKTTINNYNSIKMDGDGIKNTERRIHHLFNKKTRKAFLRFFKRKIRIPEKSSLSLSTQVSRPNIFPGLFNQDEGFITDAVIEVPMWFDMDDFAEIMYNAEDGNSKEFGIGTERCFLYSKLEWLMGYVGQLSDKISHTCLLKFICETQSIHSFHPEYPISIAFELIHLILTPSYGFEDPCYEDYLMAENIGKYLGRCDNYSSCTFSVHGVWLKNFFK